MQGALLEEMMTEYESRISNAKAYESRVIQVAWILHVHHLHFIPPGVALHISMTCNAKCVVQLLESLEANVATSSDAPDVVKLHAEQVQLLLLQG